MNMVINKQRLKKYTFTIPKQFYIDTYSFFYTYILPNRYLLDIGITRYENLALPPTFIKTHNNNKSFINMKKYLNLPTVQFS